MKKSNFWGFFEAEAAPFLVHREETFKKLFSYLDSLHGPVRIIETGCTRLHGNWAGDGQSTVLFDKYINFRDGESTCMTVDISDRSVQECRRLVSQRTEVIQQDSVQFLSKIVKTYAEKNQTITLLYLDSFDVDMNYWQPSAIHHMKELAIAMRALKSDSLVVVDDCPATADFIPKENNAIQLFTPSRIGGKGRLVSEFADSVGATRLFAKYQAGWINMV